MQKQQPTTLITPPFIPTVAGKGGLNLGHLAPRFAPLNLPFARRLETLGILTWMATPFLLLGLFLAIASVPIYQPFVLAYLMYVYLDPAMEMGARKSMWVRNWAVWSLMRDFFPVRLVKSCDLDPSKNYVFGFHPHGVISLSAWINFATEANQFSHTFTGIDIHLLTLASNFNMPFVRELLLSVGMCSASRRSCDNILTSHPGSSLVLVVGGAQEAGFAHPGTNDLILKKRFGFIKVALRNGCPLVPVYSFGENDLWSQVANPDGSLIRRFQDFSRKVTGVVPPLLHGRGVFQYSYGVVPFRAPVTTVVGRPIDCPKLPNPTHEEVQFYQQKYMEELQRIFDTHKDEYAPNRTRDLCFVE